MVRGLGFNGLGFRIVSFFWCVRVFFFSSPLFQLAELEIPLGKATVADFRV